MTSGTKIVLATATLFVAILVAYYGFLMPGAEEAPGPLGMTEESLEPPLEYPPMTPDADRTAATERAAARSTRLTEAERRGVASASSPGESAPMNTFGGPSPRSGSPNHERTAVTPVRIPVAAAPGVHETSGDGVPHRPGPGAPASLRPRTESVFPAEPQPAPLARAIERTPLPTPPATTPGVAPRERAGSPGTAPARLYVVEEGDTLSMIASDELGDTGRWPEIAALNNIDPNRLRVGQTLRLPARTLTADPPAIPRSTMRLHQVTSGDTLIRLARRYYGNSAAWTRIHDANRRLLGDDPHDLEVGMRLTIPAG